DHGATVVHNPASNLKHASGIAPVRELLDHGVGMALGTDGSISSDNQSIFGAMRFAALASKVRFPYGQDDCWVGAAEALKMATTGGAQALGLADRVGLVEPGYKADLAVLDLRR